MLYRRNDDYVDDLYLRTGVQQGMMPVTNGVQQTAARVSV